jgi:DNA-binding winged helix-turn-helix (wHTH) protein/TolB-like protein
VCLAVTRYCFGPFELDPEELALSRNGVPVKLQELPLRLLIMLVAHAGTVVTRDEVRHGLWPENTFVEFDNNLGVAVRKVREALNDNAEAPRYVATVPRRGYRFVAPVTLKEHEPVSAALPDRTPLTQPPMMVENALPFPTDVPTARSIAPRTLMWVGAVIFLLLVAAAAYRFQSKPHSQLVQTQQDTVIAEPHVRRSVAVLGFRNLSSGEQDSWLSPVFAEMLNTELGVSSDLRMISGEDVARAKHELPLENQDSLGKTTLQRLRTNPGADVVLLGSYILVNENGKKQIRLDLRLQDTARGETIAEDAVTGDAEDLLSLAAKAGGSLRSSLGVT